MSKLKEKLMLSEKGYSDLKKAITACTITNIALLLPSMVACLLFWQAPQWAGKRVQVPMPLF